ncbi:hypothetical protein V8G54_037473 [Vigna mungo]|uniref:Uncharacterized protein n=1 Tax=Vigna mungo TaxID=3915 RepID=A0AAQ3MIL9_VIGMU
MGVINLSFLPAFGHCGLIFFHSHAFPAPLFIFKIWRYWGLISLWQSRQLNLQTNLLLSPRITFSPIKFAQIHLGSIGRVFYLFLPIRLRSSLFRGLYRLKTFVTLISSFLLTNSSFPPSKLFSFANPSNLGFVVRFPLLPSFLYSPTQFSPDSWFLANPP